MRSKNYSTDFKEKTVLLVAIIAVIAVICITVCATFCHGESLATCWAFCKPGSHVSVRMEPSKGSAETGRLDFGDSFQTDGENIDGWIRCYGAGEGGWVYSAYAALSKPEMSGEKFVCAAKEQVAIRKWPCGPFVDGNHWLKSGEVIQVLASDGEWSVTTRGYVKAEYLDRYWEE